MLSYTVITMGGEDTQKCKNRVHGSIWELLREVCTSASGTLQMANMELLDSMSGLYRALTPLQCVTSIKIGKQNQGVYS